MKIKNKRLERYYNLIEIAKQQLGGKCVRCGSTEGLQFDHVDPSTKKFAISTKITNTNKDLAKELEKCQLLCSPCHKLKNLEDMNFHNKDEHGTWAAYRYCTPKCFLCRELKRVWTVEYRKTHKRKS